MGMPTLALFVGGEVVTQFMGAKPRQAILDLLRPHLARRVTALDGAQFTLTPARPGVGCYCGVVETAPADPAPVGTAGAASSAARSTVSRLSALCSAR